MLYLLYTYSVAFVKVYAEQMRLFQSKNDTISM